jgi:hypothetical protein
MRSSLSFRRLWTVPWVVGLVLAVTSACGSDGAGTPDSDAHFIPTDTAVPPPFTITQLLPDHGPVNGENEVTVRGFGFVAESRVYFGSLLVDPTVTYVEGNNRIKLLAPRGVPGPVDVKVQRPDGETAVAAGGYTYDRVSVDPDSGSITGGTFVRIQGVGTTFAPEDVVKLGDAALEDTQWVSPTLFTGRTPAHAAGAVRVTIDGTWGSVAVDEAYTFYDSADPINGGLGGGPIQGEVNLMVIDAYTDEPVVDAYVLMGPNASSPYQATTDASGRVTFSEPGLVGPQMVTVAANGYERATIVAFDARDVTLFLTPFIPPNPGTIPGQSWAMVTGLVTFGGVEFGQGCDFSQMLPEPGPDELRVIKMYQTVGDIDYTSAEPGAAGMAYEGTPCENAYPYTIYARPGAFAVYALAGVENQTSRAFIPYALGIVRGLVAGPDEIVTANLTIELPLNQQVTIDLADAPPLDLEEGPVGYKVRVFTNLGGDGYLVRLDTQRSLTDATELVVVDRLPSLALALADANYSAMVEAHNNGVYPYSKVFLPQLGLNDVTSITDWLGIPVAVDPAPGGSPSTSRMIWSASGVEPTFNIILIKTFPDGDPYWRLYAAGAVHQFTLPDLYGLGPGLDGFPSGMMYWHVIPVLVSGMDWNDFSYRYLNDRYWKATAGDGFTFTFPDAE